MTPIPASPGVYVTEIPGGVRTIVGVATSICAFIGRAPKGPRAGQGEAPVTVFSFDDYQRIFGGVNAGAPMGDAVRDFFDNGGTQALIVRLYRPRKGLVPVDDDAGGGDGGLLAHAIEGPGIDGCDAEDAGAPLQDADYTGAGLDALGRADLFNLVCIPADSSDADTSPDVYRAALALCVERRAMLLVDPPVAWGSVEAVTADSGHGLQALRLSGEQGRNAALYFPRLRQRDPIDPTRSSTRVPCGAVAGVFARTDATRGVWKAPAGMDASLSPVEGLTVSLSDAENGVLNPLGVNCLRRFPVAGHVVWGARTLRGADRHGDEYKYVPVRRLALYLEESIERGTGWAAFEPNDEALWARLRLNIGAFLHGLFRQRAFQGATPREAYVIQCDARTTTQADIGRGICNIVVGFAPLKPGEFVVLRFARSVGAA